MANETLHTLSLYVGVVNLPSVIRPSVDGLYTVHISREMHKQMQKVIHAKYGILTP